MSNTAEILDGTMTDTQVLEYLETNKDFFLRHSNILEKLKLPTSTDGNIATFSDFQNRKLAQKIERLGERNKRLVATAIQNIESANKINELTLTLLSADTKEEMMYYFREVVKNELNLDSAQLILKTDENINYDDIVKNTFKEEKTVCLRTASEETPCLHETDSLCIRSEALMLLKGASNGDFGILTLGSSDIQRFHEGQGCDLLNFLGGIMSYKLEKFIQSEN